MFTKILIANRGEIAVRIMRTCREMGIATVAVYSEADRQALHVLEADQAVFLGPAEPTESYLSIAKIIAAARSTDAQAIHPGYGFLAENPDLAAACLQAGLTFIGPPENAIRDLGDKTVARRLMIQGGVPVIPGMSQTEADPERLAAEADKIGYPVLIKAAAGGGGKGMRVVTAAGDFKDACAAAAREAQNAFGNGAIYLEKYLAKPRHVEFQILADTKGHIIHLLERECSIQRRHQKIIEETPSPALTPDLRAQMGAAAVAAAKASGYVNAGTVEFLLDQDNRFYFLEVNTRLQVEHPITEMTTGIDLVRHQIEIAAGQPLTLRQSEISARGHAIECRIYAEDPQNDFFPSPGKIRFMREPGGPGIRNDCGIYTGFQVPVEYDPILSKLVVWAETRELATRRMIRALENYVILGIKTPIPFLIDVLKAEAFQSGATYTDFIAAHFDKWQPAAADNDLARIAYIADAVWARRRATRPTADSGPRFASPWETLGHWRK